MDCRDCFAYSVRHGHFFCIALNVPECEFPECKTFKTIEQVRDEHEKTKKRLKAIRGKVQCLR